MADYVISSSGSIGPDIIIESGGGELSIETVPGPHVASFTYTADELEVSFNASASYDPDTSIEQYSWDFGDGSPVVNSATPTTTHTYADYGDYTVTLTVTDETSDTDETSELVEVDPPAPGSAYDDYAAKAEEIADENGVLFLHLGEKIQQVSGSTWDDYLVDSIQPSALGHEFIAESISSALHTEQAPDDSVTNWRFQGFFNIVGTITDFNIVVETLSNLGDSISLGVYNSSDSLIYSSMLTNNGQVISIGQLGNDFSEERYTFRTTGVPKSKGTGKIKLSLKDGNKTLAQVEDEIVFLGA